MIMMCGGVVDATTIVPNLVTHSTGEAEYCTAAMAMMACSFVRKIFNEMRGKPADAKLTIPFGIDSKAAIDIARSDKETKRTRHMERRFHYCRESEARGAHKMFHIEGTKNWTNGMTKPLNGPELERETKIYQVDVPR